MKRLKLILIFIFLMALPCRGAINTFTRTIDNKNTYKNSYRWTGKSRDFILEWAQETEDRLDGTTGNQSFYLTPGAAPTATEGRMYYDSTSDTIKYYNGSSAWVSLTGLAAGADGLHYKFVYVGAAEDAHDWIITTGDDLKFFIGGIVQHDIDGELVVTYYSDGNSNSKIGVLTPGAGTVVEMWCDGTNWYVTGSVVSATDAGVTFADQ